MPSPTRPNEWESVLKCSFSVNLGGRRAAVIAWGGRAQREIGSTHCAVNTHSILMYILQLKGLSGVSQIHTTATVLHVWTKFFFYNHNHIDVDIKGKTS